MLDGVKTISKEHFSHQSNKGDLFSEREIVTPIQNYIDNKLILEAISSGKEEGLDDPMQYSLAKKETPAHLVKQMKEIIDKTSKEDAQEKPSKLHYTNIFKDIINGNLVTQTEQ